MAQRMVSHTAMYGEVLPNEKQYMADLVTAGYVSDDALSQEQEWALIDLARCGDAEARTKLIVRVCLPYIQYWAMRYTYAYAWASSRIEYLDLVQEASRCVVEVLDRALQKEEPIGYLKTCARMEMLEYCRRYASLIVTPCRQEVQMVESYDVPVGYQDERTMRETLEAPGEASTQDARSFEGLYRALAVLAPKQQEVVKRLYGLDGYPPAESGQALTREMGYSGMSRVCEYKKDALTVLRRVLSSPAAQEDVYTLEDACQVLGVKKGKLYYTLKKHGIASCSKNLYRKRDIDALAQQNVAMDRRNVSKKAQRVA